MLLRLTPGRCSSPMDFRRCSAGGADRLDGFRTTLAEAGYQHAGVLTYVGAGTQIAAGVLLVLGLFTPLAATRRSVSWSTASVEFTSQRQDGAVVIFGSAGAEYLLYHRWPR